MNQYSEEVLEILRQRVGMREDNTACDDKFQKMEPDEVMSELIYWNLGSGLWGEIKSMLDSVGLKVTKK